MAITDPELLVLFEDWFEELEREVLKVIKEQGPLTEKDLAARLGLSWRGATFLLSKLKRDEVIADDSK
jgi:predicted ArsR family transcriptional regulator